jgi:hypothetical protein
LKTGVAAPTLPLLGLVPSGRGRFFHALQSSGQLFQRNVQGGAFIVKLALLGEKLLDEFIGALEDGAFVLLRAGNDLANVFDAFIDDFATTTLDCVNDCQLLLRRQLWVYDNAYLPCGCPCDSDAIQRYQPAAWSGLGWWRR